MARATKTTTARKPRSVPGRAPQATFKRNFSRGMGFEMGKRTGMIIFFSILILLGLIFGWFRGDDVAGNTSAPVLKRQGRNGNMQ